MFYNISTFLKSMRTAQEIFSNFYLDISVNGRDGGQPVQVLSGVIWVHVWPLTKYTLCIGLLAKESNKNDMCLGLKMINIIEIKPGILTAPTHLFCLRVWH